MLEFIRIYRANFTLYFAVYGSSVRLFTSYICKGLAIHRKALFDWF